MTIFLLDCLTNLETETAFNKILDKSTSRVCAFVGVCVCFSRMKSV